MKCKYLPLPPHSPATRFQHPALTMCSSIHLTKKLKPPPPPLALLVRTFNVDTLPATAAVIGPRPATYYTQGTLKKQSRDQMYEPK